MLLGACFKHFSITNLQILLAASSSSSQWQIIIANKWSRSDHIVLLIFVVIVYGWYPLILMSKCPSFDVYRCWWCFDDIWGPLNLSCHTMLSWILPCADAWPAPWWCLAGQRHYAVKGSSLWWHLEGRSQSAGSQVMTRSVFTVCSNMQCRRTESVLLTECYEVNFGEPEEWVCALVLLNIIVSVHCREDQEISHGRGFCNTRPLRNSLAWKYCP